jgi:hypothetical protein
MKHKAASALLLGLLAGALIAGCSGGSTVLAPAGSPPTPNASRLPAPFAQLQFDIFPIGPQITDGYDCPAGIITSQSQVPNGGMRRSEARSPNGVHGTLGGCDPKAGFPIVSPYPTPSAVPPTPLASAQLDTAQIVAPSTSLGLPSVAGWTGTLAFPACAAGTCDAGTSNGSVELDVLQSTTSARYAFALVFKNTGPENLTPPTPTPSEHPAPHMWTLYGPPPDGIARAPHPPIETFLSGAPVTLGFPSLAVTVPAGSGIAPGALTLEVSQVLTPPVYQIQIERRSASGGFLKIPLRSDSSPYRPYATTATTAQFALPSTPFAFQTDFTSYVFTIGAGQ